ncbi:MAG: hypothetical protein LBG46_03345 [Elusimicrobiota bacterium]|jgi:hypothetical protein|nr:hypothetical protein [Elusimicrobiota bacterium]
MEEQKKETITFDKIFNKSKVKINGKYLPLNFSLQAEIWLEQQGVRLDNLAQITAAMPIITMLKLVFAGLPPSEFRDKISFDDFKSNIDEKEGREILERTDFILECFFKHLCINLQKKAEEAAQKTTDEEIKKKFLKR